MSTIVEAADAISKEFNEASDEISGIIGDAVNDLLDQAEEELTTSGAVDPDLAKFLDSYEEFVDSYVAFMKNYNSNPNNMLSMLTDYTNMLAKLAEFDEKIDKYDPDNMSAADAAYYTEVMTRCSIKMLGAL